MAIGLNISKAVAMLALGLGSFVAGMAPACISQEARRRHPLLISCLLCFGAGVLLSTSLVHMLPEARAKLPDSSELMLCVGFFIVYLVDEICHLFYGAESHAVSLQYGAGEQTSLLGNNLRHDGAEMLGRCCGDADSPRMCHVGHTPPCDRSSSGAIGLLCALFVHSLLEGLAIGLQDSSSQVLLLFGAVAAHKYVVGFCLGAELCAGSRPSLCRHLTCVLIFSAGSVAGIGLGAGLESVSTLKDSIAVPIMQALAAGTLLYVTVSEVLPRERARWHERRRIAGALQLLAVAGGFTVMYMTTKYLDYDGA